MKHFPLRFLVLLVDREGKWLFDLIHAIFFVSFT